MTYPIAVPVWLDRRIDALLPASPQAGARAAQARAEARRAQLATPAPPTPPVRPGQPAAPVMAARPQRRPGEKVATGREGQAPREPQQAASEERADAPAIAPCGERQRGQGDEDESEDGGIAGAGVDDAGDAGAQQELDSQLVAALLVQSHDSGMFEVLLPGGDTLGVAVDVRPDAVDYLLTPASDRLAAQLRSRQMELAGQLGQRIGRSVRLTVL